MRDGLFLGTSKWENDSNDIRGGKEKNLTFGDPNVALLFKKGNDWEKQAKGLQVRYKEKEGLALRNPKNCT